MILPLRFGQKFTALLVFASALFISSCSGNSASSSSSSTTTTTTSTTATATTLTTSASSAASGTAITLTAAVAPSAATGTVIFYDGTTSLSSGTLSSGTATLSTSALTTGTHTLTATYGGSTPYATSTSAAVAVTITTSTASSCSSAAGTALIVCLTQMFEATLTSTQISSLELAYTETNAIHWSNLPLAVIARNGLKFSTLTSAQLTAALAIAQAALSTEGYNRFLGVRASDDYIAQVSTALQWGSGNYFIAFVGTPSNTSPWQLQIGGHHYAANITYNGTYVSATPFFVGTEPATFTYGGTTYSPLEKQRAAVYNLNQTLTSNSSAKLSGTFDDVVMGVGSESIDNNYPQTYPTSGRGVLYSSMSSAQQALVKTAIEAWVNDQNSTMSAALLAQYESDTALATTYVGYSGTGTTTTINDYIRIDGPRVWIEFVVQQGVAYPSSYHYHSIWRDKTADYGGDFAS
jgi:hypothetical protein